MYVDASARFVEYVDGTGGGMLLLFFRGCGPCYGGMEEE